DRLVTETDALGGQTNYSYDAQGNIISITDANGNTTTFTYDANNRKVSETNAMGEIINYAYDTNGNLISQTFPNGNAFVFLYDSLGNLVSESDSLGQINAFTYNLTGLLLTETDSLGNTTSYVYDLDNRITQIIGPLGNSSFNSFDPVGNLISITDMNGNTSQFSYDALRRKISETDHLGNKIMFSYDNVGNLLLVTDPKGNITDYSYDIVNRCIKKSFADGTYKSYTYDAIGNLTKRTDQNGQITIYNYDKLNRKIKVDYPDSNDNTYTYDSVGNLLTASNQNATISFAYDNAYRLTQSIQNGNTISYSYDISNNTKIMTYHDGKVIKEISNIRGLLIRIEDGSSQSIIDYTYDSADILQSKSYSNGITANFISNSNRLITELSYYNGGTQIIGLQYGFDKEGNKLYENKLHEPVKSEAYSYDAKYQLIDYKVGQLINGEIPSPVLNSAYYFDPSGNWNSKTENSVMENRTHNEVNQIISFDGVNFLYDGNGNLIDDGENIYTYDFEDQLILVARKTDGQTLMQCQYDALRRRIVKISYLPVLKELHYVYDGKGFLLIAELDSGGTTKKKYVWGPDLSGTKEGSGGIGGLVSMEDIEKGENSFYLYNNKGDVYMLIDADTGQIMGKYNYSAFGKLASSSGIRADANPFRYSTKYFDKESTLYYYGYRYYNATLGRWLTRDPLEELVGINLIKSQNVFYQENINLYLFVQNNPVNGIDFQGLWGWMGFQKCNPPEVWKKKPNGVIPPADGCSAPGFLPGSPNNPGWFINIDFTWACNNHDYCYSDCKSTRSNCDNAFKNDMYTLCQRYATTRYKNTLWGRLRRSNFLTKCRDWADTYWSGVRFGGRGPYRNRQEKNCHCGC
ncbi:MAG: RHS repeat-associated core domain-containing protein, partial [bacterium]